jgi:uroporphyrin-3 C-methyltransferase
LRLAALANQIDAIPFIEALGKGEEDDEQEIPENETVRQMLNRKFYGLLHKLRSYVRVRDHGKTVNAILPPSQQAYLQQNLRLMFEQTQVALLRNDAQIYRESLVKAQNWINQYYTLNQEASAVLAELQILQEENIAPELTNFGNTSSALADYIERQEKQAAARRGGR